MSRRLTALTPRKVIQALERGGFTLQPISGSHYAVQHSDKPELRVIIPYHNSDLKRRTLRSIIKQAGLTNDAFLELL